MKKRKKEENKIKTWTETENKNQKIQNEKIKKQSHTAEKKTKYRNTQKDTVSLCTFSPLQEKTQGGSGTYWSTVEQCYGTLAITNAEL